MSALEFAEWQAYYRLEPFGEERADLRSAIVAKTIADVNTPRGSPRAELADFMPVFDREPQTPDEQLALVEMVNRLFGGRDLRCQTRS